MNKNRVNKLEGLANKAKNYTIFRFVSPEERIEKILLYQGPSTKELSIEEYNSLILGNNSKDIVIDFND